jgi:hypothetical protein
MPKGTKKFKDVDKLRVARKIGLAFEVSSVEVISPKGGFFELEAEISRKIRPAFKAAHRVARRQIPKILKDAVSKSRVIRDLEDQSSDLAAALGLRNSGSSASALLDHIEKSVRVVLTQDTVDSRASEIIGKEGIIIKHTGEGLIKTPTIIWGFSLPALGEVSSFGSYTSYPSKEQIHWATWLLNNEHIQYGYSVKLGNFSKKTSRTGRAIMAIGGSFSLSRWTDPYDGNFIEDSITSDVVERINSIIRETIDKAIASMPDIERDVGQYASDRKRKFDLFKGALGTGGDQPVRVGKEAAAPDDQVDFLLADKMEALKQMAAEGLITPQQVLDLNAGIIQLKDLGL